MNAVRLYETPPRWLADLAHAHRLWVGHMDLSFGQPTDYLTRSCLLRWKLGSAAEPWPARGPRLLTNSLGLRLLRLCSQSAALRSLPPQLLVGLPWAQHHAVLHNPWMLDNITLTMQAAVKASCAAKGHCIAPASPPASGAAVTQVCNSVCSCLPAF